MSNIFQEKNLTEPEDVFNFLGEQQFGTEWTHLPLHVLQRSIDKSKFSKETYRRNKYMADRIFKKFSRLLKEPNVSIYTTLKPYDTKVEKVEIVKLELAHFRISKDFFLIEQEIDKTHGAFDTTRRHFWIETHKKRDLWLPKKAGNRAKHDKKYLKSILPEVIKLIKEKPTVRSLTYAYEEYLKDKAASPPSSTWVGDHLDAELKKLKDDQEI